MKSKRILFFLFVSLMWGLTISAQAQDDVLRQRVLHASHLTRIDSSDMKPWHLKVGFHLFDSEGKPSEQGTLEYWWGGPMLFKARIESPSYTATVIDNRDGLFRTTGAGAVPREINAITQDLIYPMPMSEDLSDRMPELRHETLENSPLDCIELKAPLVRGVRKWPDFCLDPTTDVLRSIHGASNIIFGKLGDFQGRSVAFSLDVKTGERNTATAEVIDLSEISVTQDLFTPSQDMDRVRNANIATPTRVILSSGEMGRLLVRRVPPEYPEEARSKGIQGTVMLRAIVSREGNVIDVSVISGDPELSKAALMAARNWKYHPYLVGGVPVEVETTIQMNFRLSTN